MNYPNNNVKTIIMKKGLAIRKLLEKKFPMKRYYKTEIPLNIFQTWHSKNLPPLMNNNIELIKSTNPAFKYHFFDDEDCYNFIKENFDENVLNAFDRLIPGAYKADLWRYCILFKLGGIYLDIKYKPVNGFKFINLSEKEHWVLDHDKFGIYNALMVCKPGNHILLKAINQIVENVNTNYFGNHPLNPTGPLLLSNYFNENDKKSFEMNHNYYINYKKYICWREDYIIFESYDGYVREMGENKKLPHYSVLWGEGKIYK
jgi:mannosyltransferase OCH1-like enzyme